MSAFLKTKGIDVVLLCGGLGRRLRRAVKDYPKPMAKINDRPFLDILIEYVSNFGFKRFILCTGYKGDKIKQYYQRKKGTLEILISHEKNPLGTGGAIKNAASLIKSSPFLVMNGDSFCQLDLKKFLNFHLEKDALLSVVLAHEEGDDYGDVTLGKSNRIVEFNEKSKVDKNSFINAGIYLFDKAILPMMPHGREFSLEYDLFPTMVNKGAYGHVTEEPFIDIGTPETFRKGKQLLKNSQYLRSGDL